MPLHFLLARGLWLRMKMETGPSRLVRLCPGRGNARGISTSRGEKLALRRYGACILLTHLPPAIAVRIVLFNDQDGLSNVKGYLVCILCMELVKPPDFFARRHGGQRVRFCDR